MINSNEMKSQIWNILLLQVVIPVIFSISLFYQVFTNRDLFIGDYHEILSLSMTAIVQQMYPFSRWNFLWLGGFPDVLTPISNIYYPLFFPVYALIPTLATINFVIILHIFLAYVFFFKLSSLYVENEWIRAVLSLLYISSGAFLARVVAGQIVIVFSLTWIPLLFYLLFKILYHNENTARNIAFLSICSSILFFTGGLYTFIFTYIFVGLYVVTLVCMRDITTPQLKSLGLSILLTILLVSVQAIPSFSLSGELARIDPIDPLEGGGSLENNIAAFTFGERIDDVWWGSHESTALIGFIPFFLMLIGLIFGERRLVIPSLVVLAFAMIWADSGKNILSFIHLLPGLNALRCSGRVFGPLMSIVLLFAGIGTENLWRELKSKTGLYLTEKQKKGIKYAVIALLLLKLMEMPYQGMVSLESVVSLAMVTAFLGLLYWDKMEHKVVCSFFALSVIISGILMYSKYCPSISSLGKSALILTLILTVAIIIKKSSVFDRSVCCVNILIALTLFLNILVGISSPVISDSRLSESPALELTDGFHSDSTNAAQIWVYDTGWPIMDIDYTYWFVKSGIHSVRAYYAYFFKDTVPMRVQIGSEMYDAADYIVVTEYPEKDSATITTDPYAARRVSVSKTENPLPNAFIIRGDQLISVNILSFRPDEVVITGNFSKGDLAVLKSSYCRGWKVEGHDALPAGNMVAYQLQSDLDTITFRFDPLEYYVGLALSLIGIAAMLLMVLKEVLPNTSSHRIQTNPGYKRRRNPGK